jgi:AcrR family transcriptional regulator
MTGEPVHIDSSGQAVRLQRADARKNRDRILTAARAAFDDGADPSMAEVARRAGVGMATLYRNFPGRRELLEAVYADKVAAVREAARDAAEELDPGPALRRWLTDFTDFARSKHGVAEALLAEAPDSRDALHRGKASIVEAAEPLLARARAAGAVKPELTMEQVLSLVIAVAGIPGPPGYVDAILQTALDGLEP